MTTDEATGLARLVFRRTPYRERVPPTRGPTGRPAEPYQIAEPRTVRWWPPKQHLPDVSSRAGGHRRSPSRSAAGEPIVIDAEITGRADRHQAAAVPILVDSDDDGECGPTWRGQSCWSLLDGNDVEPGCASRYCREGPSNRTTVAPAANYNDRPVGPSPRSPPSVPLIIDDSDDDAPQPTSVRRSPCYCPHGDDTPGCVCDQYTASSPFYTPSDASGYLPSSPCYEPTVDNDSNAATDGRSEGSAAGRDETESTADAVDTEMCGVALQCPPTPGVCGPSSSYFDAATPRPAPALTPLPQFGPDPSDSAVAFHIRYGCRPREFTVAYGVARGLSDSEARVVERIAVDLEFGPQPDSSPSAASE